MQGKIAEKNSCTQKSKEKIHAKRRSLFIYLFIIIEPKNCRNKLLLECKSWKNIAENINIKIQREKKKLVETDKQRKQILRKRRTEKKN